MFFNEFSSDLSSKQQTSLFSELSLNGKIFTLKLCILEWGQRFTLLNSKESFQGGLRMSSPVFFGTASILWVQNQYSYLTFCSTSFWKNHLLSEQVPVIELLNFDTWLIWNLLKMLIMNLGQRHTECPRNYASEFWRDINATRS